MMENSSFFCALGNWIEECSHLQSLKLTTQSLPALNNTHAMVIYELLSVNYEFVFIFYVIQ